MTSNYEVDTDPSAEKTDVVRLNRNAQRAIGIMAILLPLLYTFLSFKDVPLNDVVRSLSTASTSEVLWKIVLAVYFLLWVLGTRTDAEDQELVYRHVPNRGRLTNPSIGVLAGIFVLAAILLWSSKFQIFVPALTAFFVFNIFAWVYLIQYIAKPSIRTSQAASQQFGDYVGSEEIRVIEQYLCGNWQWHRFALGAVVISGLWGILFVQRTGRILPAVPDPISWELLQVIGMLAFVLVMEIWIWSKQLHTKLALDLLQDFGERYTLSPRARP